MQAYENNDKLKNTNHPRTIDCIYLRPDPHSDGGHELMDLVSGYLINCPKCTACEMMPLVIKQVERMAGRQGIPVLKSRGRKNEINLTPPDMIQEVYVIECMH